MVYFSSIQVMEKDKKENELPNEVIINLEAIQYIEVFSKAVSAEGEDGAYVYLQGMQGKRYWLNTEEYNQLAIDISRAGTLVRMQK